MALWVMLEGKAMLSVQAPASWLAPFKGCTLLVPQAVVPVATPWQYCVMELAHPLPPTLPKKSWT